MGDPIRRNVQAMIGLERDDRKKRTFGERMGDRITRFTGSLLFVFMHVCFIATWIGGNLACRGEAPDPFPFIFLNLFLSAEAIFLTSFVLISQNRMSRQEERWAQIDLLVNLLAEEEAAETRAGVKAICDRLGIVPPRLADSDELRRVAEELDRKE